MWMNALKALRYTIASMLGVGTLMEALSVTVYLVILNHYLEETLVKVLIVTM